MRIDISCDANPRSLARRQVSWKEGKPCYIGGRRARGLSKSERQPHPLARRAVGWRGATLGGDTARLDVAVLSNRRWRAFLLSHSGFEVRSLEEPELPKAATARCSRPRRVKWSAEGILSTVEHSPTASTAARVYLVFTSRYHYDYDGLGRWLQPIVDMGHAPRIGKGTTRPAAVQGCG